MEQEPNPELDHLWYECDVCHGMQNLTDENTYCYYAKDKRFYAYFKCVNDCEIVCWKIPTKDIGDYSYLTNWFDDKGKIYPFGGKPYEERMLAFIEYIEPYEFNSRWLYK